MAKAIGIDIGGTFIDLVISDESGLQMLKFPSTPESPERGVLDALNKLIDARRIDPPAVARIAHGSTVATNALLEGTWARTALVTTEGFRDVLEIGRQNRPRLYDLNVERPDPVIPRDLRFECRERIDASGAVVCAPSDDDMRALARRIAEAGVDAVAVVFLFSYLNADHERAVRDALRDALDAPITLSSDVLPEFREYERTSTTAVCAALRPVIERYMQGLADSSAEAGFAPEWQIMQSNGTVISADQAQREPVRILLSGPAAGVQGAKVVGQRAGAPDLVTLDMGGTSCDVALIRGGRIGQTTAGAVGHHPVAVRMNEIHTIGAGGGSIAWIDAGGALRVGPKSAGAVPGPACYGRGGTQPTVSDAHAVLGHLPIHAALGGLKTLDVEAARGAMGTVASRLRLSIEEAALGILDIADAAMERAVRVISVERGYDPRQFALLAFGGAGPLHAVSIADRLAIPHIIIPAAAGVLSALGLLASETGRDYGQTVLRPISDVSADWITRLLQRMEVQGVRDLKAEGVDESLVRCSVSADLRYRGQSHELNIGLDSGTSVTNAILGKWVEAFHRDHEAKFGHASPEGGVELVTLRLRVTAPAVDTDLRFRFESARGEPTHAPVWFDASGPVDASIVDRRGLDPRASVRGPAVLWGPDATLLVPPDVSGHCDDVGTIVLERT